MTLSRLMTDIDWELKLLALDALNTAILHQSRQISHAKHVGDDAWTWPPQVALTVSSVTSAAYQDHDAVVRRR